MSAGKKLIRSNFRNAVFERDAHKCVICGAANDLDAHHITDRNEMPGGGYVKENGITLCPKHHLLAEVYHTTGTAAPGFHPNELYRLIGSSLAAARVAAQRFADRLERS